MNSGPRTSVPLLKAIYRNDLDRVSALASKEKDLNAYDTNSDLVGSELHYDTDTALEYAISRKSVECITILLDAGADVNFRSKYGRTPIMRAIRAGTAEICELLIARGANPRICDYSGENAFDICGTRGSWLSSYVSPEKKTEMGTDASTSALASNLIQTRGKLKTVFGQPVRSGRALTHKSWAASSHAYAQGPKYIAAKYKK